jgi:hypothetical protein
MKTATSRTMKRRLNVELVSFEMEASAGAVVLIEWITEIRSLLVSAQTAAGTRAPFPRRLESRSSPGRPVDEPDWLDASQYGRAGLGRRLRRRSQIPAHRTALIDGAATVDSHEQFPTLCGRCARQGSPVIGHPEFV